MRIYLSVGFVIWPLPLYRFVPLVQDATGGLKHRPRPFRSSWTMLTSQPAALRNSRRKPLSLRPGSPFAMYHFRRSYGLNEQYLAANSLAQYALRREGKISRSKRASSRRACLIAVPLAKRARSMWRRRDQGRTTLTAPASPYNGGARHASVRQARSTNTFCV